MNESNDYSKLTEIRTATTFNFDELSEQGKQAIQNLSSVPGIFQFFHHKSKNTTRLLIFLGIGVFGLLSILALAGDLIFDSETRIIITIVALAFAGIFVHGIYLGLQAVASPLPTRIFITPLYIVKTDEKEIKYWGIWSFADFLYTEIYVNSMYSTTRIDLLVPDEDEIQVNIRSEREIKEFTGIVNQWKAMSEQAIEQKRWNYFSENDVLRAVREQTFTTTLNNPVKPERKKIAGFSLLRVFVYTVASILIALVVVRLGIAIGAQSKEKENEQKKTSNSRR